MKTTSIYRAPLRARVPGAAQNALYAGIARGLRDASMAEAREQLDMGHRITCEYLVHRARAEHKVFLAHLRAAREKTQSTEALINRLLPPARPSKSLTDEVEQGQRIAARNAAKYSQRPQDISGEWPF